MADAAAALAEKVAPDVILVGGDPRSVSLLRQALPKEIDGRVEEVSATRSADGEGDEAAHEVARMVATAAATETVELIEEFRLHLGRAAATTSAAARAHPRSGGPFRDLGAILRWPR